jgi:hypothetical protein
MGDDETVIFAEYQGGRLFGFITRSAKGGLSAYDVEYSKAFDSLCYDLAGFGGFDLMAPKKNLFWAAPGEVVMVEDKRGRRRKAPATLTNRLAEPPEPLAEVIDRAWQTETVYCGKCDDWHPCEDTDRPCRHVRWCDRHGMWSTPGERCGCGRKKAKPAAGA